MSPTIAQIDDAARIYSYRRLTSAVPSQSSIVLGLNEKIERSLLKIFLSVLGLILLLGDFSRAAKFLDLGEKANLLPEEKKLVEKAQLTVARR